MNKLAEIIKRLIAKITSGEKITDEERSEMEKALETEEKQQTQNTPAEPALPSKSMEELKSIIDAQGKKINDLMTILQAEQTQREQSKLALENEAKAKRAGEIQAIIDKAVKATYLAPADEANKTAWKNMLETNFENASKLLQTHIDAAEKKAGAAPRGETRPESKAESFTKLGSNLLPGLKEYINN